jgi:hypothetical protein
MSKSETSPGQRDARLVIRCVIQAYAILFLRLSAVGAHKIVGIGELLQGGVQRILLLAIRLKFYLYRSVHIEKPTIYGT